MLPIEQINEEKLEASKNDAIEHARNMMTKYNEELRASIVVLSVVHLDYGVVTNVKLFKTITIDHLIKELQICHTSILFFDNDEEAYETTDEVLSEKLDLILDGTIQTVYVSHKKDYCDLYHELKEQNEENNE